MTNPSILQISGESGGGQLLRSSLSLAMLTGRAFQMTNIRGKRPKPGLMRQHLTCVKAAAEVCGALVKGAEMGSTELVFKPGTITAGDNHVRSLPARARSYAPHPGYFIVIHPMDRYCRGYDKIRS